MMGVSTRVAVCMAAMVAMADLATPAAADEIVSYNVEGKAQASVGDTRTACLDDAFSRALQIALADLMPAAVRVEHQTELDRDFIGHSRLWVTAFAVTDDNGNAAARELLVTVQIDRDKLRAELRRLGIFGAQPAPSTATRVAIEVRVDVPRRDRAAAASVGVEALATVFRSAGFWVADPLPAGRTAPSADTDAAPAGRSGEATAPGGDAAWAAIADVAVGEATFVRGQAREVARITARLQVIAHSGSGEIRNAGSAPRSSPLAESAATVAGYTDDVHDGIRRALIAAATELVPRLVANNPRSPTAEIGVGESGMVLVRLPPGTPYAVVAAEQKMLSSAHFVRSASLRRLSAAGWVIGVATAEPTDRIAQLATRSPEGPVAVRVVGGVVEVSAVGTTP